MSTATRGTKSAGGTSFQSHTNALSAELNTDLDTIYTAHNNHDAGTSIWTQVKTALLTMSGNIVMASNKLTGLAAGTTAGDSVRYEQIKVFQYVTATTTTNFATTSGTFQTTNLTASITPSSATSKVLIIASGIVEMAVQAERGEVGIFRGSTAVTDATHGGGVMYTGTGGNLCISTVCLVNVDSPATTSSTTYSIKVRNQNGSSNVNFGGTTVAATQFIFLAELA